MRDYELVRTGSRWPWRRYRAEINIVGSSIIVLYGRSERSINRQRARWIASL